MVKAHTGNEGLNVMAKELRTVKRVETGPLQVGDDWPGVFIRGDNAMMGFAPSLQALIEGRADPLQVMMCQNLLKTLKGADAHSNADRLQLVNAQTIGNFQ